MIGSIRGKIILKDGNHLIVEVNGIGYRVLVSSMVSGKNHLNKEIFIYTYTYVREDALELFGFAQLEDLKLFEQLISVSGVGPKTAMSILSLLSRDEIINGVLKGDINVFAAVPRLGKKNAQKIIIELKNKLGDSSSIDLNGLSNEADEEVLAALKNFGFSQKEILLALKNLDSETETAEEKIKLTLKYLGK